MKNPRITPKEHGLLKGAINRVFSRSEIRKQALEAVKVDYIDPNRLRVKKWGKCPICKLLTPLYLMEVDHTEPRVPVTTEFKDMSLDVYVDRTWCELNLLTAMCKPCHYDKTKMEKIERKKYKKETKK